MKCIPILDPSQLKIYLQDDREGNLVPTHQLLKG